MSTAKVLTDTGWEYISIGPQGETGPPGPTGAEGPAGGQLIPFQANGVLTVKTYPTSIWVPKTANYRMRATCRDRGTGSSLIANVGINGTLALAGANRPTIAAGSGIGSDQADTLLALTQGQFVTSIDVEQVGTAWSTLTVQLIEEP